MLLILVGYKLKKTNKKYACNFFIFYFYFNTASSTWQGSVCVAHSVWKVVIPNLKSLNLALDKCHL